MLIPMLLALAAPGIDVAVTNAVQAAAHPCAGAAPPGEIVVCRRTDLQQRFRLPAMPDRGFDPRGAVDSVSRERHRLIDGDGASQDLTRGSCSAVGADGMTGCMVKGWREAGQQKGQ